MMVIYVMVVYLEMMSIFSTKWQQLSITKWGYRAYSLTTYSPYEGYRIALMEQRPVRSLDTRVTEKLQM